jgi:hypothetical protein
MKRKTDLTYMTFNEITSYREAAILWREAASSGIPRLRLIYRDLAEAYISISENLASRLSADHAPLQPSRP